MRFLKRGLLALLLGLPLPFAFAASSATAEPIHELSDTSSAVGGLVGTDAVDGLIGTDPVDGLIGTDAVDLTCPMAGNAAITPGISLLSKQDQQVEGVVKGGSAVSPLTPCTSLTGIPYTGFTMVGGGSGSTTCSTALIGGKLHGTGRVTWNNGDASVVDWTLTLAGPAPVVDATIRSGALAGATLLVAAAPSSLSGNCVVNPLTGLGFDGAVEIVNAK